VKSVVDGVCRVKKLLEMIVKTSSFARGLGLCERCRQLVLLLDELLHVHHADNRVQVGLETAQTATGERRDGWMMRKGRYLHTHGERMQACVSVREKMKTTARERVEVMVQAANSQVKSSQRLESSYVGHTGTTSSKRHRMIETEYLVFARACAQKVYVSPHSALKSRTHSTAQHEHTSTRTTHAPLNLLEHLRVCDLLGHPVKELLSFDVCLDALESHERVESDAAGVGQTSVVCVERVAHVEDELKQQGNPKVVHKVVARLSRNVNRVFKVLNRLLEFVLQRECFEQHPTQRRSSRGSGML
jgi:RNase P subunit RPR2